MSQRRIRRFTSGDEAGIERLNRRLAAAGIFHRVYPEDDRILAPEEDEDRPIVERCYVAVEDSEVRGGVWLREQFFWVENQTLRVGWAKYPVAESLIDKRFAGVPAGLVVQLLREQPCLMALGMGGHQGPFARLLKQFRWPGCTVPFYFAPLRPFRVLRSLHYIRRSPANRFTADALALSGLGWIGYKAYAALRSTSRPRSRCQRWEVVTEFGDWADEVWERSKACYGFVGLRNRRALSATYPRGIVDLTRVRVREGGDDLGWVCVLRRDLTGDEHDTYFGALRVGMLADGFGHPGAAGRILAAGVECLQDLGVDLLYSNQMHPAWRKGLKELGFLKGPSNFAFYRSPAVDRLIQTKETLKRGWHLNRGDCDGPSWL